MRTLLFFAIVLAGLSLLLWAALLVPIQASAWPGRTAQIPLAGAACAVLLLAMLSFSWRDATRTTNAGWGASVAIAAAAVLLIGGAIAGTVKPLPAALVLILGSATLLLALAAAERLKAGDGVEFNSHWGGLGGSLGGWKISSTTILLLLALIFLGAVIAVGTSPGSSGNATNGAAPPAAAPPAATPPTAAPAPHPRTSPDTPPRTAPAPGAAAPAGGNAAAGNAAGNSATSNRAGNTAGTAR